MYVLMPHRTDSRWPQQPLVQVIVQAISLLIVVVHEDLHSHKKHLGSFMLHHSHMDRKMHQFFLI